MADKSDIAKQKAKKAQEEFEREARQKKLVTIASYSTLCVAVVFLWILFTGDRLAALCDAIGIEPLFGRNSGEYADCSLPQNEDTKYCRKEVSPADRQWEAMKKRNRFDPGPAPFSLTGN